MRYFFAILGLCVLVVISVFGFRGMHSSKPTLYIFPDMEWQYKLRPQYPDSFFANGRTSQKAVPGTVERGTPIQTPNGPVYPYEDSPVNTGLIAGTTNFVATIPLPVTAQMVERGRQRFMINCSPCHGALADGNGITKRIGAMAVVADLHDKRIVEMPDGEIFYVITHGRNLMQPYGPSVTIKDRWAIVSYVRALQLSELGSTNDVPQALRASLEK